MFDLPSDVLSIIACRLSLSEFAALAVLSSGALHFPWSVDLGRAKICQMTCAVNGKAILNAIQGDTPMRPEWLSNLYLSFARKVQFVALHDHEVLIDAWHARFADLERNVSVMRHPDARQDLDALRWFMLRPGRRDALCMRGNAADGRFKYVSSLPSLKDFPAPCLMRILAGLSPLYEGTRGYQQMVSAVALDIEKNGRQRPRVPQSIAIDIALFMLGSLAQSADTVSEKLSRYLGFSQDELRFFADPIVAERIRLNDMALPEVCDRWRSGDTVFRRAVEDACDRVALSESQRSGIPPDLYRDAREPDRLRGGAQPTLALFGRAGEAMFRGDVDLAGRVETLFRAIPGCTPQIFLHLCAAARDFPYYVAPLLMRRLATELDEVALGVDAESDALIDHETVFHFFLAWRDDVVKSCAGTEDWALAAAAFAAPLRMLGHLPEARRGDSGSASAEAGFAMLPPRFWTPILDNVVVWLFQPLDSERLAAVLHAFIRDPLSSVDIAREILIMEIARHAPLVWDSLPDRGDADLSRIDAFSERFSLSYTKRRVLRADVIESIARRVIGDEYSVEEGMRRAGMADDASAVHSVNNWVWHRALSLAESRENWQATLLQHTQGSAYLRNQASIYIAGTTQTPVSECV